MADNFDLYRQAVFLVGSGGGIDWSADFAVITAYNPDGRPPGADEAESARLNEAAHHALGEALRSLGRTCLVTGCSPDLSHREPGWAANITLLDALRIGLRCRQDAIFWVSEGRLYLVSCAPDSTPELLGLWKVRRRLEV